MAKSYEIVDAAKRAMVIIGDHNLYLNDPHGDKSGRDSKAPDGDDYNVLLDAVEELAELLNVKLH